MYYLWDLCNDFTSLTFRLLIRDLILLGAFLTGQMEPEVWHRKMLQKCQWLIQSV